MTSLSLKRISKAYQPGVPVLHGINLDVADGKLLVLLGPSGCGKTTILRSIAGLIRPTSGDILFDGVSVASVPAEKRNAIMVFQGDSLFPFRSVGENVAFGLAIQKLPKSEIQERVNIALEQVQLAGFEARRPDQLSGGQKQRVALARALVMRPKFLLLDEPLSSLDRSLRAEMRLLIKNLQQESGVTTVLVTHSQEEAVAMGDRIALLIDGRMRQIGRPADFYLQPADEAVARFFGIPDCNILPAKRVSQHLAKTPLGNFRLAQSLEKDEVMLVIRPEAVEAIEVVAGNSHPAENENYFEMRVDSWEFLGTHGRGVAIGNGRSIQFHTSPYQRFTKGETLFLRIRPDRVSIID